MEIPFVPEPQAFFQWCNYLADKVPAKRGSKLCQLGRDVHSSMLHTRRGNVIRRGKRHGARQPATRADTRLNFTLVALICSEPELQPLLPQVIIVEEKTLRKQDEAAVRAFLPDNVYLVRRRSGWNNRTTQANIVTLTKNDLGAPLAAYQ